MPRITVGKRYCSTSGLADRGLQATFPETEANQMTNSGVVLIKALTTAIFLPISVFAQATPETAQPVPGYPMLARDGNSIFLKISDGTVTFPYRLPQFAAPLKSVVWKQAPEVALEIKPEIDHWILQFVDKLQQPASGVICIEFDSAAPRLSSELEPISQFADGSIWLPAHSARTIGTKLRYEPQTNKNTLGYWVEPNDKATWQFVVDRPGKFNVAILQGCGAGQGGSTASLSIGRVREPVQSDDAPSRPVAQIEFEVLETGHFQNFQWRHLSEIHLAQPGRYELAIIPMLIRRDALMDIRAIQLLQIPE